MRSGGQGQVDVVPWRRFTCLRSWQCLGFSAPSSRGFHWWLALSWAASAGWSAWWPPERQDTHCNDENVEKLRKTNPFEWICPFNPQNGEIHFSLSFALPPVQWRRRWRWTRFPKLYGQKQWLISIQWTRTCKIIGPTLVRSSRIVYISFLDLQYWRWFLSENKQRTRDLSLAKKVKLQITTYKVTYWACPWSPRRSSCPFWVSVGRWPSTRPHFLETSRGEGGGRWPMVECIPEIINMNQNKNSILVTH